MGDIDAYWKGGFLTIDGWVFQGLLDYLKFVNHFQTEAKVAGNIGEIGVHHGRFLIALSHLSRAGEKCIAIDLFENQFANVDNSGHGSLDKLQHNISQFGPLDAKFEFLQADTLALTLPERLSIAQQYGPFRIFSVDGGHTVEHTFNDLVMGQDMLSAGGVIIVDDYYNSHWPGVHEGVNSFFACGASKIKPFLYAHNKLFFARVAFHAQYLRWCSDAFRDRRGFKLVKMYGTEAVVVAD
jgi:hypothetical protein